MYKEQKVLWYWNEVSTHLSHKGFFLKTNGKLLPQQQSKSNLDYPDHAYLDFEIIQTSFLVAFPFPILYPYFSIQTFGYPDCSAQFQLVYC